jgi:hypothetical protein
MRAFAPLCLLSPIAAIAMAETLTLNLAPKPFLSPGSTPRFGPDFSDCCRIRRWVWNASGIPPN